MLVNQSGRADLRELTADLVLTAGVFYDRDNSLLASLIYSKKQDYQMRLNLYPGLFDIKGFTLGVFCSLDQDNQLNVGLTLPFFPLSLATDI